MQSLDPYAVAPKEMQELIALRAFLHSSGLEKGQIELLRLHVSRLNGCMQGIRRHSQRASALGESTARLAALSAWRSSSHFTEKERAALEWSEAVTLVRWSRFPNDVHASIRQWCTNIEIVKLTVIIAATAAWNRMEMSFSRSLDEAKGSPRRDANPCSGAWALPTVEAE
jgi:AhpD family alkylhydroperoxidase